MSRCNDNNCDFRKLTQMDRYCCSLAHAFIDNMNGFCPKESTMEEVRRNCRYYLPAEENTERKPLCRVSFYEYGRYKPCWVESSEDLLEDPDFTLKEIGD